MRTNILLALGLGLALAGCQQREASPASGPDADAAAPAEQATARQPWVWRPWPFDPTNSRIELDPASGKVQLTSPRMFAEWFDKKLPELRKGEFETTADYQKRVQDVGMALAPMATGDVYLFPPDSIYSTYDADKQVFRPTTLRCYDWGDTGNQVCQLAQLPAPPGERFGTQFHAVVPTKSVRRWVKSNGLEIDYACPVPAAEAQALKDRVQFAYGYRFVSGELLSPGAPMTLDDKNYFFHYGLKAELALALCYDTRDGRVIGQQSYDKK
ncbi:hypothetical protein [Stenotrophomonas maltophilia]|uniref:hypothetical protein n=1 Tax=Stenotrophomonas maltophilia TaxID=40324 RepID=UPI00117C9A38|nr:hypothetical protein [Stenotrophomonas maltophilia]